MEFEKCERKKREFSCSLRMWLIIRIVNGGVFFKTNGNGGFVGGKRIRIIHVSFWL